MKMKLVVVTLVIIILFKCSFIQMKSSSNLNDPNIFKCKICTEMVEIDFNYDSLMSNGDNLNKIKNYFTDSLGIDETIVNEQLGKDNLEFMTKEISMQYFFKGSESSGGSNIKECKAVKSDKCDKLKSNLCEDVVGLNRGDCNLSLIKRDNIKPKNNQMVNKKNSLTNDIIDNNNPIDIMAIIAKNAKNSGSLDLNSMLESGKNMMSNMNSSNKLKRLKSKAAINNPPKFRQVNAPLTNDYNVSEDASQYNNMSLLDISSPQMNMADLQDDPHEDVKKTFWSPPKPVLLDNFQNNLGTQLKDISLLTTYGRV